MKNLLLIILIFSNTLYFSQTINLNVYGSEKNSATFNKALSDLKKKYSAKKQHVVLFIPSGNYEITQPIVLNKYISIQGEFTNSTNLYIRNNEHEGIIMEDNKNGDDIYNGYNYVKNISLYGPDYNKNPFEWKDLKQNNPKSVGLKIIGLRNRVEDCNIDGFLWSGIEISGSFYNYINNNFVKNNRVGILIGKTSTSAYINNNEIRNNAIGLILEDDSYGNFINNNMFENNINHMLDPAKDDDDVNIKSKGTGILINHAMNNFIQNNYFEQHYNNIYIFESYDNEISSNFFALGDLNNQKQNVLKLGGKSTGNIFADNKTMGSNEQINTTKMSVSKVNDYSSNIIDFGNIKNSKIKNEFKNGDQKKMPQIGK